jgi:LAGLIDADG DNA endonuclease family.
VIKNSNYSLGYSLFNTKITNYIRQRTNMSDHHRSILIGIMLGDATIRKIDIPNNNARIIFKQSMVNFSYLWLVFTKLFPYCNSYPKFYSYKFKDKYYYGVVIGTRNYPFLNEIYDIFIENGKKRVPVDIYNELTPIALAHWIMCDGAFHSKGLIFLLIRLVKRM